MHRGQRRRHQLVVEAYGVRVSVGASDRELLDRLARVLPPGARPCDTGGAGAHFALLAKDGGYVLERPDEEGDGLGSADLEIAIGLFDAVLRAHIASVAPDSVFIHAGAVVHRGRAIVLPGVTVSGKTTLVAALVEAGAGYLSDEYAVLDAHGHVHPYARPLSIRAPGQDARVPKPVGELGGFAVDGPVPVGLVAITSYRPGASWNPRLLTPSAGMLAILEHAIAARERPERTLAAVRAALPQVVLHGERGEAAQTASALLAIAESVAPSRP